MAYAQWIIVAIINVLNTEIRVQNSSLNWGKFYRGDNMDADMSSAEVNQIGIPFGSESYVHSCGRSDSASGTEGGFDLYDGETKICRIYWSCPWGSKSNEFSIQQYDQYTSPYLVKTGPMSLQSGAIGTVTVTIKLKN
ncbi:aegerolysin domain-containing protein [Hirsutella rhossiliensis]|uniref:Aegerolysin domain-containing protein n=1 Tax=Hirsutella rhossiliensis TaxID=111463 RepID=A0A9P8N7F4_9HYPO|nr:aegerolysin domain-containing protein [Hirsutella rhossiliensis]KAH0968215.1 aegerolysin domain-containing protein [Hirsutella rhossiliensis]